MLSSGLPTTPSARAKSKRRRSQDATPPLHHSTTPTSSDTTPLIQQSTNPSTLPASPAPEAACEPSTFNLHPATAGTAPSLRHSNPLRPLRCLLFKTRPRKPLANLQLSTCTLQPPAPPHPSATPPLHPPPHSSVVQTLLCHTLSHPVTPCHTSKSQKIPVNTALSHRHTSKHPPAQKK
jgi:hypothetical protein